MGQMGDSEGFIGGLAFIYTGFDIYFIVRFVNIVLLHVTYYATLHQLRPSCILFIHCISLGQQCQIRTVCPSFAFSSHDALYTRYSLRAVHPQILMSSMTP